MLAVVTWDMVEQQLSVRSTRARTLAHKLAKRERRTISQIVEMALEAYARPVPKPRKESGAEFWERIHRDYGVDDETHAEFEKHLEEHRKLSGRPVDL
jgi:hypothetical protein